MVRKQHEPFPLWPIEEEVLGIVGPEVQNPSWPRPRDKRELKDICVYTIYGFREELVHQYRYWFNSGELLPPNVFISRQFYNH